jgi:hypothetical protein
MLEKVSSVRYNERSLAYSGTAGSHVDEPVFYDGTNNSFNDQAYHASKRPRYDDQRYARVENRTWSSYHHEGELPLQLQAPRQFTSSLLSDVGHASGSQSVLSCERNLRFRDCLRDQEACLRSLGYTECSSLPLDNKQGVHRHMSEEREVYQSNIIRSLSQLKCDNERPPLVDDAFVVMKRSSFVLSSNDWQDRRSAVGESVFETFTSRKPSSSAALKDSEDWRPRYDQGLLGKSPVTTSLLFKDDMEFSSRLSGQELSLQINEIQQLTGVEQVKGPDERAPPDTGQRKKDSYCQGAASFKLVRDHSSGTNVCEIFLECATLT